MRHVINELASITGKRINKIYQLEDFSFLFSLRGNETLLISASKHTARMHLTEADYHKPLNPPMFCMLLRKHLENGVIESVQQIKNDRIALIRVRKKNELNDTVHRDLIFEALGKDANVILTDENKIIIDCLNHTHPFTEQRTMVPSASYEWPSESRENPYDEEARNKVFTQTLDSPKALMNAFMGISPQFANEWWHRSQTTKQHAAFITMLNENDYQILHGEKLIYASYNITHRDGEKEHFDTASKMLDAFYSKKDTLERYKQQAKDLRQFVRNGIKRTTRKIEKLNIEKQKAEAADNLEIKGQLLLAYPHEVPQGAQTVSLPDFTTDSQITIELDRTKNAVENAKDYFEKYNKQKKALPHIKRQIIKAKNERAYFRLLDEQLTHADLADLEEMREELKDYGYLSKQKKKQQKHSKKAKHLTFTDEQGVRILVGKNNTQNAHITHELASPNDVWFHVKDAPGSHVLAKVDLENITETTLRTAALLAAHYSKMRYSSSVAVDYTKAKHIRKIRGQKPCFVTYKHQKTIYIDPDESFINSLKKSLGA